MDSLVHGNLGTDSIYKIPETDIIGRYLPITLELVLIGLVLAIVLGVFTGTIAASRKGGVVDQTIKGCISCNLGESTFYRGFHTSARNSVRPWSSPSHRIGRSYASSAACCDWFPINRFPASRKSRILLEDPTAFGPSRFVTSCHNIRCRDKDQCESSMIDVLDKDYIKLAYMKGFSKRQVVYRTAFKNAIGPIITLSALFFGTATAGAVIVEDIFQYHGIGFFTVQPILNLDNVAILAIAVIVGVSVIIANLIADILYGVADPRIRLE